MQNLFNSDIGNFKLSFDFIKKNFIHDNLIKINAFVAYSFLKYSHNILRKLLLLFVIVKYNALEHTLEKIILKLPTMRL